MSDSQGALISTPGGQTHPQVPRPAGSMCVWGGGQIRSGAHAHKLAVDSRSPSKADIRNENSGAVPSSECIQASLRLSRPLRSVIFHPFLHPPPLCPMVVSKHTALPLYSSSTCSFLCTHFFSPTQSPTWQTPTHPLKPHFNISGSLLCFPRKPFPVFLTPCL